MQNSAYHENNNINSIIRRQLKDPQLYLANQITSPIIFIVPLHVFYSAPIIKISLKRRYLSQTEDRVKKGRGAKMKESNDGFVRADQIDLKTIDEQLERHLNKALTKEKKKQKEEEDEGADHVHTSSMATAIEFKTVAASGASANFKKQRQEWEIDPSNLIIKGVIARGTFGTVHRGVYDGQDVAGKW